MADNRIIKPSILGKHVEIMDGPRLPGQRMGTLSISAEGLHFRAQVPLLPFTWSLAWEEVAEIQIGRDIARRWSAVLPMKVAHQATHLTVVDQAGRYQGFVIPNRPLERIQNQLQPTMGRWNGGRGQSPAP